MRQTFIETFQNISGGGATSKSQRPSETIDDQLLSINARLVAIENVLGEHSEQLALISGQVEKDLFNNN